MPIRQRGDSWQIDVAFEGLRKQQSVETEFEAKRLEPILLQELKELKAGKESKRWTLKTAVEKCHAIVWKGTKAESFWLKNQTMMLAYFGPATQIADIDSDWVDSWIVRLEEGGNSGSTVNRKLACLSRVLTFAVDRGALDKKPRLERRQEGTNRIRWLTIEEERTVVSLFKSWEKHDHVDVTVFLVDTGARPGEAFKLTAQDCNLEAGTVTFWETKNGVSRTIPMTLRVKEIISRRTKDSVRPFPFTDGWYHNQWLRVRNRMGLQADEGFVPYALRHTCASRLAQKGVSLQIIKEWLGHKSLTMTLRYAHLTPASLMAGAKALDEVQERDKVS
jgi:integrase